MSSILTAKDIKAFANLINSSPDDPISDFSAVGTVIECNDPIDVKKDEGSDDTVEELTAQVDLDGGDHEHLCTASYNGIEVNKGDRVLVSIQNGAATITENYSNPNGNSVIVRTAYIGKEEGSPEGSGKGFAGIAGTIGDKFYRLIISSDLPVDKNYIIIGLKSIEIEYTQTETINWTPLVEQYIGGIHLTSWSFNDNSITVQIGTHQNSNGFPNVDPEDYKFRLKITYVTMIAKNITTNV